MGGDLGPTEFIRGLFYATEELQIDSNFILCGNGRLLERLLKVRDFEKYLNRIEICPTTQVIGMDEKPIQALKSKKDSSMVRAIALLKEKKAQALVSCGNTGALMAGGTLRMRPLPGVDRPALATIVPSKDTPFVLVDVGANPESTAENLLHNAVLGSNYAKAALRMKNPRIGLLTIGTEEGKGNTLINKTHAYLQKIDGVINYVGPIEGFQLFDGKVDVVVCDGNTKRKIGAVLAKSAFSDMKTRLGPDQHAGAPLLGIQGNILKTHGSSNYTAIGNALRIARTIVAHDMIDSISSEIQQANALIQSPPSTEPTA